MATSRGVGFSAEIAAKREGEQNSAEGQQRARDEAEAWIEALTGAPLAPRGDLGASLKDGVRLCELLNACVPGTIPEKKINRSPMPFKQMENITSFLRASRALGVPEPDLFETVSAAPLLIYGGGVWTFPATIFGSIKFNIAAFNHPLHATPFHSP